MKWPTYYTFQFHEERQLDPVQLHVEASSAPSSWRTGKPGTTTSSRGDGSTSRDVEIRFVAEYLPFKTYKRNYQLV